MRYLLTQDRDLFSAIETASRQHGIDAFAISDATPSGLDSEKSRSIVIDQPFWSQGNPLVLSIIESARAHGLPVFFLISEDDPSARDAAFRLGADEVLLKTDVLESIERAEALHRRFELKFWGVRGTLPVSGPNTLKYGGSTSSLGLRLGLDRQMVFDAGTGLRNFSNQLGCHEEGRFDGRILITHPHWDHLNCLPFFDPFYNPKSRIRLMGPPQGELSFKDIVDGQMNGIYFPIGTDSFNADVTFEDLTPGQYVLDGIAISALKLDHPGCCLGYRVDFKGRSVAYITDNELGPRTASDPYIETLCQFLDGVDALIHDCSYFDDEYPRRKSWGHSSIGQVVHLATVANAKHLFLFHHDPEHEDRDIDRKQVEAEAAMARLGSRFECHNAKEGDTFDLQNLKMIDTRS